MKILFLIDPNSIHDIKWIKYFSLKSDFDCFFICRKHHYSNQIVKEIESNFNLTFLGTVDYFSIVRPISTLRQLFFIHNIIKNYKIEIFHIQYAEPNALWALVKHITKIKTIITCRGTDVLKTIPSHFAKKDFLNRIVKRLYKSAFQKADWITVTSQKQWDSIKNFSRRKNHFSIIRTGVELEDLKKDTTQFFRGEITKPFILFPRFIKPLYNHEFCLKAIDLLNQNIKGKYQMVFVGKDGGDLIYQQQLEEIMTKTDAVEFIFLPKLEQKEIWELYKRAELIVMTPKSDGSPVSGMEAIALGQKLILGPLKYDEDIFNQASCFKLKKWDTKELASQIKYALGSDFECTSIEKDAIDFNANMKKVADIYAELGS